MKKKEQADRDLVIQHALVETLHAIGAGVDEGLEALLAVFTACSIQAGYKKEYAMKFAEEGWNYMEAQLVKPS